MQDGLGGLFCGFVLNVNVVTGAHKDSMDTTMCCCFSLGEWEGGHLVLDELGLVFEMQPGEIICFDSSKIVHFNMHYVGERMSVVLQSDKFLDNAKGLAKKLANLGVAPAA